MTKTNRMPQPTLLNRQTQTSESKESRDFEKLAMDSNPEGRTTEVSMSNKIEIFSHEYVRAYILEHRHLYSDEFAARWGIPPIGAGAVEPSGSNGLVTVHWLTDDKRKTKG